MKKAIELQHLIDKVKDKLEAEEINLYDYDRAIACLNKCVAPNICIDIYNQYINY